jgi:predicted DNA-binding transcriptional regulator AlpA
MTPALSIEDARLVAEQLADVLTERGLIVTADSPAGRVLDVGEVAGLLGRSRDWVYEHAAELGAFKMGEGPRARLGFDAETIEAWKRTRAVGLRSPIPDARPLPRARRRTATTGDLIDFEDGR